MTDVIVLAGLVLVVIRFDCKKKSSRDAYCESNTNNGTSSISNVKKKRRTKWFNS